MYISTLDYLFHLNLFFTLCLIFFCHIFCFTMSGSLSVSLSSLLCFLQYVSLQLHPLLHSLLHSLFHCLFRSLFHSLFHSLLLSLCFTICFTILCFTILCFTLPDGSKTEYEQLNDLCRRQGVTFLATNTWGMVGFMFQDCGENYKYIAEKPKIARGKVSIRWHCENLKSWR